MTSHWWHGAAMMTCCIVASWLALPSDAWVRRILFSFALFALALFARWLPK